MIIPLTYNRTLKKYFKFPPIIEQIEGVKISKKSVESLKNILNENDIHQKYFNSFLLIQILFNKLHKVQRNIPDQTEKIKLLEYFKDIQDNKIYFESIIIKGTQKGTERDLEISTNYWKNDVIKILLERYKDETNNFFHIEDMKEIYKPPSTGRNKYSAAAASLAKCMVNYLSGEDIIQLKKDQYDCAGKMLALNGFISRKTKHLYQAVHNLFEKNNLL